MVGRETFLKSFLKALGPNLSEKSARRVSQSIGVLKKMMDKVDGELGVNRPTGTHRAEQQTQDVLTLIDVFMEGQLFTGIPGSEFTRNLTRISCVSGENSKSKSHTLVVSYVVYRPIVTNI